MLLALLLSSPLVAQKVSPQEAADFALKFFQRKSGKPAVRMAQIRLTIQRGGSTPDYFLFEPTDGKGYVLVAGQKASVPVLGYSLKNRFPTENVPPAMQYLLNTYAEQLDAIKSSHIEASPQRQSEWKNAASDQPENDPAVQPLLTSNWGQGWPYNLQCPDNNSGMNAVTGCVATAMAQLMNYWNFPSQTVATSDICLTDNNALDPDSDIIGTWCTWAGGGYNWPLMLDVYNNSSSTESRNQVAKLMFDCGVGAQMDYGTNNSYSYTSSAAYAMDTWFGYSDCPVYDKEEFSTDWKYILTGSLVSGRPIFYSGINGASGHAWVVDGYDGDNYFHMNWGWSDGSNDYFLLTDLTPGSFNFNSNQKMFIPVPQGLCQLGIDLNGFQNNVTEGAAHWIHSNATISAGNTTTFHAGNEITLTDGFVAYNGSNFHAFIQGCDYGLSDGGYEERAARPAPENAPAPGYQVSVAPNPFSGSTLVTYTLPAEQPVAIQLLDATGKLVATPLAANMQPAGEHQFTLEAADLPTGLYFLMLQMGGKRETRRLVLTQ